MNDRKNRQNKNIELLKSLCLYVIDLPVIGTRRAAHPTGYSAAMFPEYYNLRLLEPGMNKHLLDKLVASSSSVQVLYGKKVEFKNCKK